ncbi:hypothetical protein H2200_010260 [Cladophialophora chaetospira]|uniref:Transmembrane protein 69 n=1 Tax=Cladophialophora chaetospira TaxID=386627 RepID=A0AA39CER4_9EURO|nr:hypothetical protein H2200_010260 [Cladophialophora chaetospira]
MSASMLRTTAARSIPRSFSSLQATTPRTNLLNNALRASLRTSARPSRTSRILAVAAFQPVPRALVRYAHNAASYDIAKAEKELGERVLKPVPDEISLESSTRHVTSEMQRQPSEGEEDVDMMAGIRSDFNTIKETFSLAAVPREAMYVGLAGVIPYLATSITTVYLSFDIQYAAHHGQGFLMSGELAESLLHIIEPIQLGYGASIISFLGAIHWGLEFGGYGGFKGYPRYSMGIIATAVAWPTLLLSAEVGLITQFLAFTFLYYNDARASARGWAPPWYGVYRFVLTFIVGASIVASLIGRGQIADLVTRPPGPADKYRELRAKQIAEIGPEPEGGEDSEEEEGDDEE